MRTSDPRHSVALLTADFNCYNPATARSCNPAIVQPCNPARSSEANMSGGDRQPPLMRRSFLSRLGVGVTALGAAFGGRAAQVHAQRAGTGPWQPARHAQDNWLDELPGRHRLVFDTTTADGLEKAMNYAHNYLQASEAAYGLKSSDLAIVIIARHVATVFAYGDAMWAKYGTPLSQMINFTDRKTKEPPSVNVYRTGRETSLDSLAKRGVQFAVCEMATRVYAEGLARRTSGDADAIHKELMSNLIMHSHSVPAGIVTVGRAQERGYALAHGG
jgi:intracellular sulfur oxidation DsrE/DsrF family protein